MLLFTIILGIISGFQIHNINKGYDDGIKTHLTPLEAIMEAEVAFSNMRQTSRGVLVRIIEDHSTFATQKNRLLDLINTMDGKTNALVEVFSNLDTNNEAMKTSLLIAIEMQQQLTDYRPLIDKMMVAIHQKNLTEAVNMLNETNKITDLLHTNIIKTYGLNIKAVNTVVDTNYKKVENTIMGIILIIVVSIIIGIIFAAVMSKVFSGKSQ
jgi:hypothetical protein